MNKSINMKNIKKKGENIYLTITVNGEPDYCAWHRNPNIGSFHCSYCCPSYNLIYYQVEKHFVQTNL